MKAEAGGLEVFDRPCPRSKQAHTFLSQPPPSRPGGSGTAPKSTQLHSTYLASSLFLPRVLWSASATLRLSVEPRPAPLPPSPGQRLAFGGGLVYALRDASRLGGLFALTCFRHSGQTRPLCSPQRTPWSSAHPQPALARTISVPQEQGRANL